MAKNAKKIRVRIRSSQVVRYDQTFEMTPEEWAELKKEPSPMGAYEWLDKRNVYDADDPEEASAEVVDAKGKRVGDGAEWSD